jgi:hypothetical protein
MGNSVPQIALLMKVQGFELHDGWHLRKYDAAINVLLG